MPTQIKYLSIDLTIGGHEIVLETDDTMEIAELGPTTSTQNFAGDIKAALKKGVSFRMEKGKVISVNLGEFIEWAKAKIDQNLENKLIDFFKSVTQQLDVNTLKGITIYVWNLAVKTSFDTKINLSFTFFIKVKLAKSFYDGIFGIDPNNIANSSNITNIINVSSVGFGMSYSS